jgi:hypothetical protein
VRKGGYWEAVLIHKHSSILSVATPARWPGNVRAVDLIFDAIRSLTGNAHGIVQQPFVFAPLLKADSGFSIALRVCSLV